MRIIRNINEEWHFLMQQSDIQNLNYNEATLVNLPHTWNNIDGQDGGNDYIRDTCIYEKKINLDLNDNQKVYIEFNGVAHTSTVIFNGIELGIHKGGYSTFRYDITQYISVDNVIQVIVDNNENDSVYPQKADFTFYGGIYRDVNLIIVPENHFELNYFGTPGIKVTPIVDLNKKNADINIECYINGVAESVVVELDDEIHKLSVIDGVASGTIRLENVRLWDGIRDPYQYELKATLDSGDTIYSKFGCRHFEIDPQNGFYLNGRSYPLRGVSRHQDYKGIGNALTLKHHQEDMELIKEIGANTIRLAHYQHSQDFYNLCDEVGMIVWAEIPYITLHMNNGLDNTISQMTELIVQNYNHSSIITWGLSNEITAASIVDEDLIDNHKQLNQLCHKLDSSRPTTMANVFMLGIDSPLLEIPDINSYNLYFGWYLGDLIQNDEFFDEYHEKFPNRVIGFSEYGADANPKFQSSTPIQGDYTESYQTIYHEHIIKMIEKRPWLWATHVWNMFDFGADGRDEGEKNGENQKGLVSFDRKTKKDAFYLYKAAWNKNDSFIHISGKRYVQRNEANTEIKVFSNNSKVALYKDGILIEEKNGDIVFKFNISLEGTHQIKVISDGLEDSFTVEYVENPNSEYTYRQTAPIANWFDSEDIDENFYSVNDTLNEIRMDEKAALIIDSMMNRGANSHGDVAEAVKDNPDLQRMIGKMKLLNLLVQGGTNEEEITQINRILQTVRKGTNE